VAVGGGEMVPLLVVHISSSRPAAS
jgi:hypothetical protein